jgi:hypothetical protein
MRKGPLLIASLLVALWGHAQWDVPVRVVLDGDTEEDRQVRGLADPTQTDAAVSMDALRSQTMSYAVALGSTELQAALSPAPAAYTPGMSIILLPDEANAADATINLNGLGSRPILKWGGLPLDSADVVPGTPVRLIYDGESFHLLSSTYIPCPAGFRAINRQFCVSDSLYPEPADFFEAANICSDMGARLCTFNEWAAACRSVPGFLATIETMEWIDHGANNLRDAKVVGAGWNGSVAVEGTACEYGRSRVPETILPFRCCKSR